MDESVLPPAVFSLRSEDHGSDDADEMEGVYEYPPSAVMTTQERARSRVAKRERESNVDVTVEQEDQVLFEGRPEVWNETRGKQKDDRDYDQEEDDDTASL